jgi:hypothetical protein
MIYICPKHKVELNLCRLTQGVLVLGYLWMCPEEDCDETVDASQEEIDNYVE